MRVLLKLSVVFVSGFFAAGICLGQSSFSSQSIADAFVTTGPDGSFSASNFGSAGALAVSASGLPQGEFQSVLKFDLSGAANSFNAQYGIGDWTVQSVTLQLTAAPHSNPVFNNVAAGQFGISLMQNNSWLEGTGSGGLPTSDGISYNLLLGTYMNPAVDQALGTFSFAGGSSGQNSYSLSASSSLIADILSGSDASLRLFAGDSSVSYLLDSRTGGGNVSFHPMINVTVAPVPEPSSLVLCVAALAILWLVQTVRRWLRRNTER
jgi:hypothetical protein